MAYTKKQVLLILIIGFTAIVAILTFHFHIAKVRAAHLDQVPAIAPYFPPGAIWTQDISHAPSTHSPPPSSTGSPTRADGAAVKCKSTGASACFRPTPHTPLVPIHNARGFYYWNSDIVPSSPASRRRWHRRRSGYQCDTNNNDCHLIVVDRSHGKLYEAYAATVNNGALDAAFLAVWDLNRIYPPSGRGEGCTSADAAGFPIAPLLFNADELAKGSINHAIRFILPNPRMRKGVYVHPATHAGAPSGPDTAPPMGVHFRLKASYDMSQLSPAAQVVARAMQKYGMFLSDGGNIALTAQSDADTTAKYSDVGFDTHSLWPLKVTDFEVVDLGKPIRSGEGCVLNR